MSRKRRRSAWHALSESQPHLYHPSHTSSAAASATPAPAPAPSVIATAIVTASPARTSPPLASASVPAPPSSTPPPSSKPATLVTHITTANANTTDTDTTDPQQPTSPNVNNIHTPKSPGAAASTSPSTPLVVTKADVHAACHDLGLTPRTPSSASASTSTVFLDASAAAAARALLSSTRRRSAAALAHEDIDNKNISPSASPSPRMSHLQRQKMRKQSQLLKRQLNDNKDDQREIKADDGVSADANMDVDVYDDDNNNNNDDNNNKDVENTNEKETTESKQRNEKEADDDFEIGCVQIPSHHTTIANNSNLRTPVAKRRLSSGSTVTPLALNFGSPYNSNNDNNNDDNNNNNTTTIPETPEDKHPRKQQPRQHHAMVPSPITPAPHHLRRVVQGQGQTETPAIGAKSLFKNGKDEPVSIPVNAEQPMFTTGRGNAIPVPPVGPAQTLFTTGRGDPVAIAAQLQTTAHVQPLYTTGKGDIVPMPDMAAQGLLFTTGHGVAIPVPAQTPARVQPLFTTGKGDVVPVPAAPAAPAPIFTTGRGNAVPVPVNQSLFTTGRGDTVPAPANLPRFTTGKGDVVPLRLRTPSTGGTMSRRASVSGSGSGISSSGGSNGIADVGAGLLLDDGPLLRSRTTDSEVRTERRQVQLLQGLVTPPTDGLRKTLFRDSTGRRNNIVNANTSTGRSKKTPMMGGTSGKRLRNTPFKRPRVISRPKHHHGNADGTPCGAATSPLPVPHFDVPKLRVDGRLTCAGRGGHVCDAEVDKSDVHGEVESLAQTPGCLERCARYSFPRARFGRVDCLPGVAATSAELWGGEKSTDCVLNVQRVVNFVQNALFHGRDVARKPATTVGSNAWTTMAYALAVNKLAHLQYQSSSALKERDVGDEGIDDKNNGSIEHHRSTTMTEFFTAANVVRELLRRVATEWHAARQPPLLRMLRRDTSPASHVVLRLVDMKLLSPASHEEEDAIAGQRREKWQQLQVIVSDGWHVARATVDEPLGRRLLSGWVRLSDQIHITGASLAELSNSVQQKYPWFFGSGDELDANALRLRKNGVYRVRLPSPSLSTISKTSGKGQVCLRMGIRPVTPARSLRAVLGNGGAVPAALVVVLRAYQPVYMQTVTSDGGGDANDEDDQGRKENEETVVWRREEAEVVARANMQERRERRLADRHDRLRRRLETQRLHDEVDEANICAKKPGGYYERDGGDNEYMAIEDDEESGNDADEDTRDVTCVQELLVCGIDDCANDSAARRLLRVYRSSEELQSAVRRAGSANSRGGECFLHVLHMIPRRIAWTCKGDAIWPARSKQGAVEQTGWGLQYPRRLMCIADLARGNAIQHGDDFDGAFYLLHVTNGSDDQDKDVEKPRTSSGGARNRHCSRSGPCSRFVYLVDDSCGMNDVGVTVLALELCKTDARDLPRALNTNISCSPIAITPSRQKSAVESSCGDDGSGNGQWHVVGLRDVTMDAHNSKFDIIHAHSTLRSSFQSGVKAQKCFSGQNTSPTGELSARMQSLTERLARTEVKAELDIVREAVVSFASGKRATIASYFSGTQSNS